jgi:hypothetical protein
MKTSLAMISAIAISLLLAGAPGNARAHTEQISADIAGTTTDGDLSTGNPQFHSYLYNYSGRDGGKPLTWVASLEFLDVLPDPVHCSGDQPFEYPIVEGGMVVVSFVNTADQLYLRVGPGSYECDSADALFKATDVFSGTVVGGRGKYAGATGSWTGSVAGGALLMDQATPVPHYFSAGSGSFSATVNLPNH